MESIVWTAPAERVDQSNTARFMAAHGIGSYRELLRRSVDDPEWFWHEVVSFLGIPFARPYSRVRNRTAGLPWTTWFDDGVINLSAACVDRWATETPEAVAIVSEHEDGTWDEITFTELLDRVSRLAGALHRLGVGRGDPVAVFLPMSEQAVVAFLAIARLGALFIPIFSGYGAEAVATRITDPRPRVLICADGYVRRGKAISMKEIADEAVAMAGGIEHVVVVPYANRDGVAWTDGRDIGWDTALSDADPLEAVDTPAETPVVLAYTSGTTGRPKGAVLVHGGLTVKLAQEGAFQADFHPGDRITWLTDMGWIMGPWMVIAGLTNGATIVTYDGAADSPGPDRVWAMVEKHRLTFLGLSPTFVRTIQPHGAAQARQHDLSSLHAIGSTGEPWNPDPWWWLFRDVGNERIPIINLSGGTEIGACILSVNLLQGIKPTSVGGPSLGMAADVVDADGRPIRQAVGELVIGDAWPGMTRGFWNEPERYLDTYWRRFPDRWVHGDWGSIDSDGFWFLHGRSDDTLNIAGKRVGPAEIESAAVELDEIVMAAAIGVPDPMKGEVVVVYAVPAPTADLDALEQRVEEAVAAALGHAFRPKKVVLVGDLPRTRSAKIMRRVVRALATGADPGDLSSLENPQSLAGIEQV